MERNYPEENQNPEVKKRILALARQLPLEAAFLHSVFATRDLDHYILGEIVDLIERRCHLTCKRLEAVGPGGDELRHSSVFRPGLPAYRDVIFIFGYQNSVSIDN